MVTLLKKGTLAAQLLFDNPTLLTRTDFSGTFADDNMGTLYVAEDPWTEDTNGDGVGETVYYFAGNALNNWVKFGKYSTGSDLYWRIIRSNEDKSVRLLYVGTETNTTAGYISTTSYNGSSNYNRVEYIGYMYGETDSLEANKTNTTRSYIK